MPNALFTKGRESFLKGVISWTGDTIKAVLVDSALYTVDLETDEFLSDIPFAARVATSAAFTGKTATGGVADADDISFTAVTGEECAALVIYQDAAGIYANSRLIAYMDTATGLPIMPDGGDINFIFSSGADKIFKL